MLGAKALRKEETTSDNYTQPHFLKGRSWAPLLASVFFFRHLLKKIINDRFAVNSLYWAEEVFFCSRFGEIFFFKSGIDVGFLPSAFFVFSELFLFFF